MKASKIELTATQAHEINKYIIDMVRHLPQKIIDSKKWQDTSTKILGLLGVVDGKNLKRELDYTYPPIWVQVKMTAAEKRRADLYYKEMEKRYGKKKRDTKKSTLKKNNIKRKN